MKKKLCYLHGCLCLETAGQLRREKLKNPEIIFTTVTVPEPLSDRSPIAMDKYRIIIFIDVLLNKIYSNNYFDNELISGSEKEFSATNDWFFTRTGMFVKR